MKPSFALFVVQTIAIAMLCAGAQAAASTDQSVPRWSSDALLAVAKSSSKPAKPGQKAQAKPSKGKVGKGAKKATKSDPKKSAVKGKGAVTQKATATKKTLKKGPVKTKQIQGVQGNRVKAKKAMLDKQSSKAKKSIKATTKKNPLKKVEPSAKAAKPTQQKTSPQKSMENPKAKDSSLPLYVALSAAILAIIAVFGAAFFTNPSPGVSGNAPATQPTSVHAYFDDQGFDDAA